MAESSVAYRKMTRTTVFDKTVEAIKRSIVNGELKPGDRLPPEGKLASMMGIGRGTVREALQVLIHLGLLSRTNKVTAVTADALERLSSRGVLDSFRAHSDLMEMIELRKILEPEAAVLAAERCSDQALQEIEREFREMLDNRANPERFIACDNEFHAEVLKASGNSLIAEILKRIQEPMLRTQLLLAQERPAILPRSVGFHERILAALKGHDADTARRQMLGHVLDIEKEIHALLKT